MGGPPTRLQPSLIWAWSPGVRTSWSKIYGLERVSFHSKGGPSFSALGAYLKILITGGAGFIGSAVVRRAIADGHQVVNLDALTYSANLENVESVASNPGYAFEHVDICDRPALERVFETHRPDAVMHLAAESHNDRAIEGPLDFVKSNILGTAILLEVARAYWLKLEGARKDAFRFHHISTDEVFGALGEDGDFTEETPTTRVRPIRPRRPLPTTWSAPGGTPTSSLW